MDHAQPSLQEPAQAVTLPTAPVSTSSPTASAPANPSRKRSSSSRHSLDSSGPIQHASNHPYGYVSSPQQHQQHPSLPPLTNIDPALEGVVKNFMRSEKYARKIKYIVRATSVPGRQNYKFAPATSLTQQETRMWRNNLMQDDIASNNPFWTARWMRVFGIAPRLDDSLLKVPWIKCERPGSSEGDARSAVPLHRKETYLDLRDEQNRNWAMDSFAAGINCAQKGQLDDAIKAYSQAIQIDSKCVEAYVARGCTLTNIKKWRAAIMDFRAALALDPSNTSARQYLESTIAQEEEHRLNPSLDSSTLGGAEHLSGAAAFNGTANLDNINEIVLDTDGLENVEGIKGNSERKKKKKKSKNKRKSRDHYDGSERARDMVRDRNRARERSRDRSNDRSKERSGDRSRDRGRNRETDRYFRKTSRRAGSRSRSPRSMSRTRSKSRSRSPSAVQPRRRSRSRSPARHRSSQRSPYRQDGNRKRSRSPLRSRSRSHSRSRSPLKRQIAGGSSQYRPEKRQRDVDSGKNSKDAKELVHKKDSKEVSEKKDNKDTRDDGGIKRPRSKSREKSHSRERSISKSGQLLNRDQDKERKGKDTHALPSLSDNSMDASHSSTNRGPPNEDNKSSNDVKKNDKNETKEEHKNRTVHAADRVEGLKDPVADEEKKHDKFATESPSDVKAKDKSKDSERARSPAEGNRRIRERDSYTGRGRRRDRSSSPRKSKRGDSAGPRSRSRSPSRDKDTQGRKRSRSDSQHRRGSSTARPRSRSNDRGKGISSSTRRDRSQSPDRTRGGNQPKDNATKDHANTRARSRSNSWNRVNADRTRDRSQSNSRSRRGGNRARSRSRSSSRRNRGNDTNNSRGGASESKGQRERKRTKSKSPMRSGGGGGSSGGGGRGRRPGGGGGKLSGANSIEVSKDFMEQRKRMRMKKGSQSRSRSR